MVRKLKRMPYANAKVIETPNETRLQSYETIVATLSNDGWLSVNGLYSMTTRKHISAFVREYTDRIPFDWIKRIAGTSEKLNIYTAELVRA